MALKLRNALIFRCSRRAAKKRLDFEPVGADRYGGGAIIQNSIGGGARSALSRPTCFSAGCLSICLSFSLSLSLCMSACLSVSLSVYMSVCLCLSVSPCDFVANFKSQYLDQTRKQFISPPE